MSRYTFETHLLHNKHKFDPATGGVSVPIQHASTFHQPSADKFGKYDYSRSLNPTREALEEIIAELEGGVRGFAFSSGMAAISTAFLLLSQGDHVVITEDVYGGTYRMVTNVLNRFGIEHTFVDMTDLEAVEQAIRPNTALFYAETPSNPLLKVTDIQAISEIAKKHGALTFVDNTFMTPYLQRPLELGADIVLHSATKFLSGHSDTVAGLAVVKDEQLANRLYSLQNSFGAVLGVQDAWLVMRGIKTLSVRMNQSQQSAKKIAGFLKKQPLIKDVFYPGLANHPQSDLQIQQAYGPGAVLSFELEDAEVLTRFIEQVKLPVFAVSLGAVESILSYPAKMSHAAMPQDERERRGITDGLLRLSVGLENAGDLIADFEQAFDYIGTLAAQKEEV
ncbi:MULTISPECIES: cystathionine beta-lyase [unclassified Bacillus (in: firmicutes)]|uniref:cystathionine beta-lyase n=1 Tax=unclassified Bacillus (in: firmicutes) TaxID=185979 RepID=UPI001BE86BC7|nr:MULTISPECIES: cystathionine beta-lyase [unclassified Bacillus (in: firmicutes)]MBT2637895.1 cystathionine beta-lyase [Bacillus sp. ISL-39]MBT2661068.1 cystathionine beta-lyase [Bacillus sp. ISL-45]